METVCPKTGRECVVLRALSSVNESVEGPALLVSSMVTQIRRNIIESLDNAQQLCNNDQNICGVLALGGALAIVNTASDNARNAVAGGIL